MSFPSGNVEGALELERRKAIYTFISRIPGIHFRELQRQVGAGTGNVEYHLRFLEKVNLIKVDRQKVMTRYYPLGLNQEERAILGVLRQENFRKILLLLLEKGSANQKAISSFLKITPSSTTWYATQLIESGIINVSKEGRERHYYLIDKDVVAKILITYRESFLDALVDKFVATFEE